MDWMLLWPLLLIGFLLAWGPGSSSAARFIGHVLLVYLVLDHTGIEVLSFIKAGALAVCILCSFSVCLQFC